MITIIVDQLLSNSDFYEHIFMQKIKNLYKYSSKCDYQQKYKAIIEESMVSTPEGFTDNSPMSPGPYMSTETLG